MVCVVTVEVAVAVVAVDRMDLQVTMTAVVVLLTVTEEVMMVLDQNMETKEVMRWRGYGGYNGGGGDNYGWGDYSDLEIIVNNSNQIMDP